MDVTEVGGGQRAVKLEGSDVNFLPADFYWFVEAIDIVEFAVSWDALEILQELT